MNKLLDRVSNKGKLFLYRNTNLRPAPTYPYMIEPLQLVALINELQRVRGLKGSIAEIGVFRGTTTRFVCEHFVKEGIDDTTYFAIDTFDSFTREDMAFEVEQRGKEISEIHKFVINDFEVWKRHFAPFPFVKAIQADCSAVNYAELGPLKLVFLDVDLYLPTKKTLPMLYDCLVPGGVILIDDVLDGNHWDGAYQAYVEYCDERHLPREIIGNKCGVIRKP